MAITKVKKRFSGLTEPVIQGEQFPGVTSGEGAYKYRRGAGLIASREHSVYFNDFYENTASNALPGTTFLGDTGATLDAPATDAISYTGVLSFESDGTTEGGVLYWPKNIQLGLDKAFFMETRLYVEVANDSDAFFGLSNVSASTNPEDLWTTACTDLIAFGVADGDATVSMLCDKNNAGTSAQLGTYDLQDATWHTLGIEVGGSAANSNMFVKGYVDGHLAVTWATETSIPDDLTLSPFIGARNGSATTNNIYFDYIRWSLER